MSKQANVVDLNTGSANFVELKSAFEATQENADLMAMYRPTKAHRVAFERICQGLYQPNDKKFYLLSGAYGAAKSHLCLMTANVLTRSSGDPEIASFDFCVCDVHARSFARCPGSYPRSHPRSEKDAHGYDKRNDARGNSREIGT